MRAKTGSGLNEDTEILGSEDQLFKAIQDLKLAENDIDFPLEAKLAYQCSWTTGYATRVIAEYRRFLYLTQVCSVPIAPSDAVDQAWHLHLLQTHFYWDVMCTDLLGKPLHHTPTLSGPDGKEADVTRYSNALREYKKVFQKDPPSDIWPSIEDRFTYSKKKSEHLASGKCSFSSSLPIQLAIALMIFAVLTTWGLKVFISQDFIRANHLFLFAALVLVSIAAPFLIWMIGLSTAISTDLDPYETAYLKGGANHVANTALIRLVDLGLVTFSTNGKTGDSGMSRCHIVLPEKSAPIALDAIELAIFSELSSDQDSWTLDMLSARASSTISRISARLTKVGLINRKGTVSVYDFTMGLTLTVLAVLFAILMNVPDEHSFLVFLIAGFGMGPLLFPAYFLWRLNGTVHTTLDGKASFEAARTCAETGRPYSAYIEHRNYQNVSLSMKFAVMGSKAVINDKRFYGINYLVGAMTATDHSDDNAGCGDNLPKCG